MAGRFESGGAARVRPFAEHLDAQLRSSQLPRVSRAVVEELGPTTSIAIWRVGVNRPDFVQLDPRNAVLWVDSPDRSTFELVRSSAVAVFGGEGARLKVGQVVSLAPLKAADADAIVPTPALDGVRVTSLSIQTGGRRPARVTIEAHDVLAELNVRPDLHVRKGILTAASVEVRVRDVGTAFRVEIAPPMTLGLDWHRPAAALVMDYLVRRGFVLAHTTLE